MAPLAHTLALLAMTVATAAIEVRPLDMAQNSFDDQYLNCGPAMTKALPALKDSELQQNLLFSWVWAVASNEWQDLGSRVSPLSSSDQAIALKAYTIIVRDENFNPAVCEAGSSRQEYRDKFHYKTLHFLLTQALATLRVSQGQQCRDVSLVVRGVRFQAKPGDIIRFGQFVLTSLSEKTAECFGTDTMFQVKTCHGADIKELARSRGDKHVLIPPFETFEVISVTQEGKCPWIHLRSTGNSSNYNCEWLRGGSVPMVPFQLGGLLLTTTALAVATGIL